MNSAFSAIQQTSSCEKERPNAETDDLGTGSVLLDGPFGIAFVLFERLCKIATQQRQHNDVGFRYFINFLMGRDIIKSAIELNFFLCADDVNVIERITP